MTSYHRVRLTTLDEAAAFVAALSRFLNSPKGAAYVAHGGEVGVWSETSSANGELTIYLSDVALAAAMAAFSPVPVAGEPVGEASLRSCRMIIGRSAIPAWGLSEAKRALTIPNRDVSGMSSDYVAVLLTAVERAVPALVALGDEGSRRHPARGKWSPREVIGHLVDSASNNHERFVRAQLQDDLVFPGYDQAEWVRVQRYAEAPWEDLVALWAGFNRHIARVMAAASPDQLTRPRVRHNLHELAWVPVAQDQPATLEYFMRDYVQHLRHHLRQVLDVTAHPWLAG